MLAWRGPFDPEAFSVAKVNRELEKKFRPVRKRAVLQPKDANHTLSPKARQLLQAILSKPAFPQEKCIRIKPNEAVPVELNVRT